MGKKVEKYGASFVVSDGNHMMRATLGGPGVGELHKRTHEVRLGAVLSLAVSDFVVHRVVAARVGNQVCINCALYISNYKVITMMEVIGKPCYINPRMVDGAPAARSPVPSKAGNLGDAAPRKQRMQKGEGAGGGGGCLGRRSGVCGRVARGGGGGGAGGGGRRCAVAAHGAVEQPREAGGGEGDGRAVEGDGAVAGG